LATALDLLQQIAAKLDTQINLLRMSQSRAAANQKESAKGFLTGQLLSFLPPQFQSLAANALNSKQAISALMPSPGGGGAPGAAPGPTPPVGGATGGGTPGAGALGGSGAADALGGLAEMAGPVAIVAESFVLLKTVLVDLPKAIISWANSLLQSQRAIAKFSPELTAIFARMDVRTMQQERQFGANTAQSTELLAEQMGDLNESLVPFRSILTNLSNTIAAVLVKTVQLPIDGLSRALGLKDSGEKPKEVGFELYNVGAALDQQFGRDGLPPVRPLPAFPR
jgi:hypothetical protein